MGRANEVYRHGCGTIVQQRRPCPKCTAPSVPAVLLEEWPHIEQDNVPTETALAHMRSHPAVRYKVTTGIGTACLYFRWERSLIVSEHGVESLPGSHWMQMSMPKCLWLRLA